MSVAKWVFGSVALALWAATFGVGAAVYLMAMPRLAGLVLVAAAGAVLATVVWLAVVFASPRPARPSRAQHRAQ